MVKKNDAPTEIETITLTMSRPVAEAVQAACEWYLRLHMGQFWDVADDLCMAKFYSDAKHNEFKTKEQRDNAFTVSIHRRNDMQDGLDNLYRRYVLPAPISDLMEIPYRAEQVWLVIRHALAWHDKPEGDWMNVEFDKPLNRSDQPRKAGGKEMRKIFMVGASAAASVLLMTGCNKQVIDLTYEYSQAQIKMPDGTVIEGKVDSWNDYEGDQLQVKINGTTYLAHSSNVVLWH